MTIYCISRKSEVLAKYKEYEAWMRTQDGRLIKVLQSGRGGEYLSKDFDSHLKANSTIRSLTVHSTPKENGVAERLNHTVAQKTVSMFSDLNTIAL